MTVSLTLHGINHQGLPHLMARDAPPRFSLDNPPDTWQKDQTGTNQCVKKFGKSSPNSTCETAFINSISDFCLFGPPNGPSEIGDVETEVVAYCTQDGHGTRLIPDGTFTSILFLKTENYVEVLGTGDLTRIGVKKGDSGGELDPHAADGTGNPKGGLVYTTAFTGKPLQIDEWMQFISDSEFCFRACNPKDPLAWQRCQHIYDTEGCAWNMPSSVGYDPNQSVFETCEGDDPYFPGIYGSYTYHHGDAKVPDPHPPPTLKNCQSGTAPTNGYKGSAGSGSDSSAGTSGSAASNSSTATTGTGTTTGSGSDAGSSSSAAVPGGSTTTTAGGSSTTTTTTTGGAKGSTSTSKSGAAKQGSGRSAGATAVVGLALLASSMALAALGAA